jgi:hypothetical protein
MFRYTKEVAKDIRTQLKAKFPKCKFSVRMKSFSGGSSISVSLMTAPIKVLEDSVTQFGGRQYVQVNEYQLSSDFRDTFYSDGKSLTREGFELLGEVYKILLSQRWFNARDSFLHLEVGQWDKPFTVKGA